MTSHAVRTNLGRLIGLAILLGPLAPRAMGQELPDLEFTLAVRDHSKIADSPIQIRGEKSKRGEIVPRVCSHSRRTTCPARLRDECQSTP